MERTARGPRRAPARLVTPRSIGTPTRATSRPAKLVAAASDAKRAPSRVAGSAKGHFRRSGVANTRDATEAKAGSWISPPLAWAYFARNAASLSLSMREASPRSKARARIADLDAVPKCVGHNVLFQGLNCFARLRH